MILVERKVGMPYPKDYDTYPQNGPLDWASRFDTSTWGLLSAYAKRDRIGSAVVAWNTANVEMLEGRSDVAVLWDLRVHPELRGRGIGTALFQAVEGWARSCGCTQIKVETQNINVPACRFYARQSCSLEAFNRLAYEDLPDEVQLVWFKDLAP
ncbi:MAG: GNAT family N-acetyltransferase [Longimicrobiales bacterium]